ncbi:hypothetical protein ACWDZ4_26110 [Streptomyces sp. NPDC003016]
MTRSVVPAVSSSGHSLPHTFERYAHKPGTHVEDRAADRVGADIAPLDPAA